MKHHRWGYRSLFRLNQAHPEIRRFADACLIASPFDLSVYCVYRNDIDQEKAFSMGASTLHFPDSIHNQSELVDDMPTMVRAIDFGPVLPRWEDMPMWFSLCGMFRRVADELEIPIVSGLDWNSNWHFKGDQSFWDGPHWQLKP